VLFDVGIVILLRHSDSQALTWKEVRDETVLGDDEVSCFRCPLSPPKTGGSSTVEVEAKLLAASSI